MVFSFNDMLIDNEEKMIEEKAFSEGSEDKFMQLYVEQQITAKN